MKIIKQGIDPKDVTRHARCNNCTTEYEFTLRDPALKYTSDQRDGNCYYFDCETCGRNVYVSSAPLPPADRFAKPFGR